MAQQVSPTKANLISAKKNLALAKNGYEMLNRKRSILMHEMMRMIEAASDIQNNIGNTFSSAYSALQTANVTLGIETTLEYDAQEDVGFQIQERSVMGVDLPVTWRDETTLRPFYGFWGSNAYLDTAYTRFDDVKDLASRLGGVENSVYRLATAIKKTQRRANMLEYVVIPRYEALIRVIADTLEEHEREEFTRMKVVKRSKNNR